MKLSEETRMLLGGIALIIIVVSALLTPILYLEGSAKSAYLKEYKDINIPWYRAAFLHVQIHDIDLKDKQEGTIRQSTK